jgi:sirohydrochlorin ferrochelatase
MIRRIFQGAILTVATMGCTTQIRQSQPPVPLSDDMGILVMAHGGEPEWNKAVQEAVRPIRRRTAVTVAFGMAERDALQAAVDSLERSGMSRVAVVRLFISGSSFRHRTEYLLGLRDDPPTAQAGEPTLPPIRHTAEFAISDEGLVDAEWVGTVLAERAQRLSNDPASESVLILAHGMFSEPANDLLWVKIDRHSEQLRQAGFHAVRVETLREDWPAKREPAEQRIRAFAQDETNAGRRVIVIPFRLFGFGHYDEVLKDLSYVADGTGLLPDQRVTAWIEEQAASTAAAAGWAWQ